MNFLNLKYKEIGVVTKSKRTLLLLLQTYYIYYIFNISYPIVFSFNPFYINIFIFILWDIKKTFKKLTKIRILLYMALAMVY